MKNTQHLIKKPVYFSQDTINKINSFSSTLKLTNFSLSVNYLIRENFNSKKNLDNFGENLKDDILSDLKNIHFINNKPFSKDLKILTFENKILSNEIHNLKEQNKLLEQQLAFEKENYSFLSQKISSFFDDIKHSEVLQ